MILLNMGHGHNKLMSLVIENVLQNSLQKKKKIKFSQQHQSCNENINLKIYRLSVLVADIIKY